MACAKGDNITILQRDFGTRESRDWLRILLFVDECSELRQVPDFDSWPGDPSTGSWEVFSTGANDNFGMESRDGLVGIDGHSTVCGTQLQGVNIRQPLKLRDDIVHHHQYTGSCLS